MNYYCLAYALEKKSEHPLARAILAKAEENGEVMMQKSEVRQFQAVPGNGLSRKTWRGTGCTEAILNSFLTK